MSDRLALRLDDVETRIAFQERTIEELNAAVTDQWRIIDGLTRKLAVLEEHVRTSPALGDPRSEPPPPHY